MTNHMKPASQPDAQLKTISDWILDNTYTASFKPAQNKVEVHPCHPLFYLLNQESQQAKQNWLIFNSSSSIIIVTHFGPFGKQTNALLKEPQQQSNRVRDKRRISPQHQTHGLHGAWNHRYDNLTLKEMVMLLVFFFVCVIELRLFCALLCLFMILITSIYQCVTSYSI